MWYSNTTFKLFKYLSEIKDNLESTSMKQQADIKWASRRIFIWDN